jgi:hypothetical protein
MDDPTYCRKQALECAKRALSSKDRRERKVLTRAAQVWLKMAVEIEARIDTSADVAATTQLTDAA